ncbi:MAG: TIGR00299 family protein [Dehalococcoidia bacterium]|nr:TIGR00299 family protein [Dehalococcoidia bacterium]
MSRSLWINPAVGVSGDMLLGALFDVGASEDFVIDSLSALEFDGWEIGIEKIVKNGILATRVEITCEDTSHHRSWSHIDSLIATSSLEGEIIDGARKTFKLLGEIEANRHGIDIEEVHFHEVGAIDSIIDIVGVWAALKSLKVNKVISTKVGVGSGSVETAHGLLPNPAPATMDILKGCEIKGIQTEIETVTPTGAALLVSITNEWGSLPESKVIENGFGAGFYNPVTHPNVLNVILTENDDSNNSGSVIIETTLDDVTPETLGHLVNQLISNGADDAWVIPVTMKKTRPGYELKVLCSINVKEALGDLIAKETGTLGLRTYSVEKTVFPRTHDSVIVRDCEVKIKIGPHGFKPEYEDLASLAENNGMTLKEASKEALVEWEKKLYGSKE